MTVTGSNVNIQIHGLATMSSLRGGSGGDDAGSLCRTSMYYDECDAFVQLTIRRHDEIADPQICIIFEKI